MPCQYLSLRIIPAREMDVSMEGEQRGEQRSVATFVLSNRKPGSDRLLGCFKQSPVSKWQ